MSVSNINSYLKKKINAKGNVFLGRVEAAVGDNQVPPQDRATGVAMSVNTVVLSYAEVRTSLA